MIGKTFYLHIREEVRYFVEQEAHKQYIVAGDTKTEPTPAQQVDKGVLAQLLRVQPLEVLQPQDPNFDIVIPKIGANARIISNVDTANEKEYLDALQHGVAHAAGTAFPGEQGHIFLFAHSTDYIWNVGTYNAVFYLLYKLEAGDEVNLFYKGKRHIYKVIGKEIVDPSQVEYLTRKTNREFLTMQTCWPPGTTLKRQMVFAVPVSE